MSSSKPAPRRNLSVSGLIKALDGRVDLRLNGWEILGDVMVVSLDEGYTASEKRLIGETIIRLHPKAETVINRTSINDEIRKPASDIIAGSITQTIHVENGCRYKIDPTRVMFSFGNKEERKRMGTTSSPSETVVDMFSCVGQFTIPLAKHSQPEKVIAIEKNPVAFEYLKDNIILNKLRNVEPLLGDCREVCPEGISDRVIMGYLFETETFFPTAIKALKDNGIIHYHFNCTESNLEKEKERVLQIAMEHAKNISVLVTVRVKSYAPKMYHWVLDLQVAK
jgi:tRNA wybutosine-synthesizing protein 2